MSPPLNLLSWILLLGYALASPPYQAVADASGPAVTIRNGTLTGTFNTHYKQDFFLGIPYAAPPVGPLRLQKPSAADGWTGNKKATVYSPRCMWNSLNLIGFSQNTTDPMDEDCLYLNVVRPSGTQTGEKLPVLVWIHGGGYQEGSARDGRNNGTFLVETSRKMKTPIIFVTFNYRLGAFGILPGREIEEAGLANLNLQDQRQALRWIQENIADFGGDPSRVTIMGESVGGLSVGFHLLAYDGRDDGLFSGAIAQSGGPPLTIATTRNATEREADFREVLEQAGCLNSTQPLVCLREVPADILRQAGQKLPPRITVDGDMVGNLSAQLRQGRFVRVPLMIGTTRNECTTFVQEEVREPIDTEEALRQFIGTSLGKQGISNKSIQRWSELYQDEIDNPSEGGLGTVLPNPGSQYGSQYGKATLWLGDMMFATNRRLSNRAWANYRVPSYSFLFDTVTAPMDPETLGAAHFQEMPYVFGNTQGVGYDQDPFPSNTAERQKHYKLAEIMSRMWISFVTTQSPNSHQIVPDFNINWPEYSKDKPQNMVFSVSQGTHLQFDTWRVEAIDKIAETYGAL
ncbi:unnamed protein product [Fusarium venenatum]|uniref:Carboxylesterase type B domain-containing protein n=1 Tax=Fusarium venenatum TaxID=56646 RepID=A0A2L2TDI8_9HYPO|nr:uncharacterized protein FVRRES_00003 [Fusarium venenatum]CEI63491.1 unnamed protein product [Fusarium venenatum]